MRNAAQYRQPSQTPETGYAMAGLLVAIAVMSLMMTVAMPSWKTLVQREREAELVFRGGQYARAIRLYGERFAGAYPPSIATLLSGRFLRKEYGDPMMKEGEFEVVTLESLLTLGVGQNDGRDGEDRNAREPTRTPFSSAAREQNEENGLVVGVRSRSTEESVRELNGLKNYADWIFTPTATGLLGGHTAPQPPVVGGVTVAPGAPLGGAGLTQPGTGGAFGGFGGLANPTGGAPDQGNRRGLPDTPSGASTTSGSQRPGVGPPRGDGPGVGVRQPPSRGGSPDVGRR